MKIKSTIIVILTIIISLFHTGCTEEAPLLTEKEVANMAVIGKILLTLDPKYHREVIFLQLKDGTYVISLGDFSKHNYRSSPDFPSDTRMQSFFIKKHLQGHETAGYGVRNTFFLRDVEKIFTKEDGDKYEKAAIAFITQGI